MEVSTIVDEFASDPRSLGRLIEVLAAVAPTKENLPFIGTVHLENAYISIGDEALQILESTHLPRESKIAILSGFQNPGYLGVQR